jgi:hypothetical protein
MILSADFGNHFAKTFELKERILNVCFSRHDDRFFKIVINVFNEGPGEVLGVFLSVVNLGDYIFLFF